MSVLKKPDSRSAAPSSAAEHAAILRLRHDLFACIRNFFAERGYLEVQTPTRIAAPALEDHIDAIPADGRFLRTSPELHMKRLLAGGCDQLYQLGPCFRRGENGSRHLSEFTMLEWYRIGATAADLQTETAELLRAVADHAGASPVQRFKEFNIDFHAGIQTLAVADAFAKFADGASVHQALAAGEFERILVERVEPHLGTEQPVALTRYPARMAALARLCEDDPSCAERWELYLGGMEIANAFSELTDPAEQRRRFKETAEFRRRNGHEVYPLDQAFLDALEAGLPPCAGIALGVDRLLMILANHPGIRDVVPFARDMTDPNGTSSL